MKKVTFTANGFSLIEIAIVLAVLGILAALALPDFSLAAVRGQMKESAPLIDVAKRNVATFYALTGKMPADNVEAGLPEAAKLVGKHVTGISVQDGAVHVTWGNSVNSNLLGKVLTVRPAYVDGQQAVPVSWICSAAPVPVGMLIAGLDKTDLPVKYTPIECKAREVK